MKEMSHKDFITKKSSKVKMNKINGSKIFCLKD
jgi:hypothetical protein